MGGGLRGGIWLCAAVCVPATAFLLLFSRQAMTIFVPEAEEKPPMIPGTTAA